jgi:hypothetical protein
MDVLSCLQLSCCLQSDESTDATAIAMHQVCLQVTLAPLQQDDDRDWCSYPF